MKSTTSKWAKRPDGKKQENIEKFICFFKQIYKFSPNFLCEPFQPANQDFEPLTWYDSSASVYFNWKKNWNNKAKNVFPKMPQENLEIGNSGLETNEEYLTDDMTVQALNFIHRMSKNNDKPFFLYFSHFAVYSPYEGKQDEIDCFDSKPTKGWNNHTDSKYASMIKSMDRSVGAILKKLEVQDLMKIR